ncbi:flagellin [Halosimplex pelagicum]|uniref:Flagellin n=1 Tax=Halosimplex pelagicum TaxID=869886 RepID=A0A7D5TC38_9EURY|nr:flagellin [Halosimplex pelagicum]QLH84290.1 flagellin [Halosimplex pelagicum]
MGFSVSGSLVVVLLGLFIALSAYYGSVSNAGERLHDARSAAQERADRIADSDIAISGFDVVTSPSCGVRVEINNTGSTTLLLSDTDLLLGNQYRTGWADDAVVDGTANGSEPGTDLWFPGERLTVEETGLDAAPRSVKVVSGPGVAASRGVTAACS